MIRNFAHGFVHQHNIYIVRINNIILIYCFVHFTDRNIQTLTFVKLSLRNASAQKFSTTDAHDTTFCANDAVTPDPVIRTVSTHASCNKCRNAGYGRPVL